MSGPFVWMHVCLGARHARPPVIIKAPALRSRLGTMTIRWSLYPGQYQFRPQPTDRGVAERQAAAIERGEVDHDRQPEPRARLGFVQPLAAPRNLGPLGRREPPPVVVDNDPQSVAGAGLDRPLPPDFDEHPRGRPFAGIVDQIAGHLLEVLPLAAKFRLRIGFELDHDAA